MSSDGLTLANIVSFRIGAKLTAAQIVPFLNSGISLIEGAGSYAWDTVSATITPATNGQWQIPATTDVGRDLSFTNPNNLPVVKVTAGEALSYSKNFKNVGSGIYNSWYFVTGGNLPGMIQFDPPQNPALALSALYHKLAPVLTSGGGGPVTPWLEGWLDDMVCDYAEGEIKRILNWIGWQEVQARFVQRLQDVRTTFTNQRENTGAQAEVQQVMSDKMQSGRV